MSAVSVYLPNSLIKDIIQNRLQEFNKILEPVLNDVIKEKNAQIVLSRSAVVFSGPSVDATQAVISKLDQRSPSVNVSRQRLPAK